MPTSWGTILDRALGCLNGAAIGDALGMPTQDLTSTMIRQDYGSITDFVAAGPHQLIAAGAPAGMVTDDTEQLLILAKLLIENRHVDPKDYADRLLDWEDSMRARGSLDLLGPSTTSALKRLRDGCPTDQTGDGGTTNGAAMRAAPLGIAYSLQDEELFLAETNRVSAITHNSSIAIASAAAVAGAVSAALSGQDRNSALATGLRLACEAAQLVPRTPGPDLAARTTWAMTTLHDTPPHRRGTVLEDLIGTTFQASESVPAAFAIVASESDPWQGLLLAANAGGDTDTVASIAGALYGSIFGNQAWPPSASQTVSNVNNLDLLSVTRQLLDVRKQGEE